MVKCINQRYCYEHDVRLSVCLSVTLVECDHTIKLTYLLTYSETKIGNGYVTG